MGKPFTGAERIDLFAQELIAKISSGKTETISKVAEEMEAKNVVHYLFEKYRADWFLSLDGNCPYNVDDWEELYSQYSFIDAHYARRKFGIENENDGLLLLVSLTFDILRDANK